MKKRLIALFTICILLLATGCGANSSNDKFSGDYVVKYSLKINPEFEIYADENLTVVGIEALNEDAESVLSAVDVAGLPVADAFSTITEEAKEEGYMTLEKGNSVDISIEEIDEEIMEVCPVCGGCGTVECWDCQGFGYHPCERCDSTGTIYEEDTEKMEWVLCDECNGEGIVTTPDSGCWACSGSGVCYLCGGTGYEIVTNEFGETIYVSEGVPETDVCTFCHGSGSCTNCIGKYCHRCNNEGTGEKPGYVYDVVHYQEESECPDCAGTGKITCGCELNGYRWCPCCWGSGIDGTGYENYDYSIGPYENWYNNRDYN